MAIVEVARSSRSSCRICRKGIAGDALRFGEEVGSAYGDGEQLIWFHLECAALKRPEHLIPALKSYKPDFPHRKALEAGMPEAVRNRRLEKILRAELAPSGQAKCMHCKKTIENRTIRLVVDQDNDPTWKATVLLHLDCAPTWVGPHNRLKDHLKSLFRTIPNARCTECNGLLAYMDGQLACNKCGGMFELSTINSKKKSTPTKKKSRSKAKAKPAKKKAKKTTAKKKKTKAKAKKKRR